MKKIGCAIDIGSSNIVSVIGRYDDETKKLEVLGSACEKCSEGIDSGTIKHMKLASTAIKRVIEKCEEQAGFDVNEVIVAIRSRMDTGKNSKGTILFKIAHGVTEIKNPYRRIEEKDIENVINDAYTKLRQQLTYPFQIFDYIPLQFAVDGIGGIKDPINMEGEHLTADVGVFLSVAGHINNILHAVTEAGFRPAKLIYGMIPLSEELLYSHEKENGCMLVDFGGTTIGISIYVNNICIDCKCLSKFGGDLITRDIAYELKIHPNHAEEIKCKYGYAYKHDIPQDEEIELSEYNSRRSKIKISELCEKIIMARVEDILEKIKNEVEEYINYFSGSGIVLCGGGSLLHGCASAFERYFDLPCRIASLHDVIGPAEVIENPKYFTAICSLKYQPYLRHYEAKKNIFQRIKDIIFGS